VKVLVTGHDGYIGTVLTPLLLEATGARVTLAPGAGSDTRSYRVDFGKQARLFEPGWTVRKGVDEILAAYTANELTLEDFLSPRFQRLPRLQELVDAGELDDALRRRRVPA
jgi:hypothetical protein